MRAFLLRKRIAQLKEETNGGIQRDAEIKIELQRFTTVFIISHFISQI